MSGLTPFKVCGAAASTAGGAQHEGQWGAEEEGEPEGYFGEAQNTLEPDLDIAAEPDQGALESGEGDKMGADKILEAAFAEWKQ